MNCFLKLGFLAESNQVFSGSINHCRHWKTDYLALLFSFFFPPVFARVCRSVYEVDPIGVQSGVAVL